MEPLQEPFRHLATATVSGKFPAPHHSPTMTPFLTVKEAARLMGKSPSSIRRIIYPIIHNDTHPDRQHVQPGIEEAVSLRMKGENFAWKLTEELLRREVPDDGSKEHSATSAATRTFAQSEDDLLTILRRELDIKNAQITEQAETIKKLTNLMDGLSERLHEGNVLIATLQQQQRLLPAPRASKKAEKAEPAKRKTTHPGSSEKGTARGSKGPKRKHGFRFWLFG